MAASEVVGPAGKSVYFFQIFTGQRYVLDVKGEKGIANVLWVLVVSWDPQKDESTILGSIINKLIK